MYIPITFKKLLEIGKQKEEFRWCKYLTFIQNRWNFHKKFTRRKCSWKYSPSTWQNYTPILTKTYGTHITMVKKYHIVFNMISTQIYPCSKYHTLMALIPPSRPVPLPKGIRGTLCSLHSRATPDTCSTLSAKATTWGGAHLE